VWDSFSGDILKERENLKDLDADRGLYRVCIKSFPDYKYLLQENYV